MESACLGENMKKRGDVKSYCNTKAPDIEKTKAHIMLAGKELLLAAQGALKYCRHYVENSVSEASKPQLLNFFEKAADAADELSRGLAGISSIKKTAQCAVKPLLEAMGKEMKKKAHGPHKRHRKQKHKA